jgi:hypothetical protein
MTYITIFALFLVVGLSLLTLWGLSSLERDMDGY